MTTSKRRPARMAERSRRPVGASQKDTSKGINRKRRIWMGELESILLICLLAIFFPKPLNPSCSVQEFLLACEKRMAARTDLNMDLLLSTLRFKGSSTGAFDHGIKNFRVNILLHFLKPPLTILLISHKFSTFLSVMNPRLSVDSRTTVLLIHRIEKFPVALGCMHLL